MISSLHLGLWAFLAVGLTPRIDHHCKRQEDSSYNSIHMAVRRGVKKAAVALGHTLLVIIYHVLTEDKDYEELGGNYFDERDRQALQK